MPQTPPPFTMNKRAIYAIDNLRVLKGMDNETVDLIYLDPPFNKREEFNAPLKGGIKEEVQAFIKWFNEFNGKHELQICDRRLEWKKDFEQPSFKDTWQSDEDFRNALGWNSELEEDYPKVHKFMTYMASLVEDSKHYKEHVSYLTFMAVRLVEMRRVLKPTGAIFLHCDDTMSHYIKLLLDHIFDLKNYRNTICWERIKGSAKRSQFESKNFGRNTDHLFYYVKSDKARFYAKAIEEPYPEGYIEKNFRFSDERGPYKKRNPFRNLGLGERPTLCYTYKGISPPSKAGWRYSKARLVAETKRGNVVFEDGKVFIKERPSAGMAVSNFWKDIDIPGSKERVGYPTQKPLALLHRIIKATTKEGDFVLDPFCGCATTCIAAHQLNRDYVGIDISEASYVLNVYRLYKECYGWTKTGLFNGRGVAYYAEHTPRFKEKAPRRRFYDKPEARGYVYIISNPAWPNQYKVGIAASPQKRLRSYNTADPKRGYALEYQKACLNYRDVERTVHEEFPNDYEWVEADLKTLIAFIEKEAVIEQETDEKKGATIEKKKEETGHQRATKD